MELSRRHAILAATVAAVLVVPSGASVAVAASGPDLVTDPVRYVDPFIGSSRGGNTWPGASRPFGMIAWSPTSTAGDQTNTAAANGYSYGTTRLRGFSLTHVNGAGCHPGAAGDVPIMPYAGAVTSSPTADTRDERYAASFSHANESATPGRYTVTLDSGVRTDLAVTTRAGVGEFHFPSASSVPSGGPVASGDSVASGGPANLLFRVSNSLNGSEDAEITIDPANRTVNGSVLTGAFCGRRANGGTNNRRSYYRLYFSAEFDRDFTETGTWHNGDLTPGGTTASGGEGYRTGGNRAGLGSGGWVGFGASSAGNNGGDGGDSNSNSNDSNDSNGIDVRMRIGISYVDLAGAVANRRAELPPTATADSVASTAGQAWNRELRRIRVGGGTEDRRTAFYTAVYHSLLQPQTVSDVDGRYLGSDMKTHRVRPWQRAQYGTFSGWDQYRAQIQLLALLRPDVAGDFAQSLLGFAEQDRGIWDRWLHLGGATHVMTGDPAAPTLATFVAMGVRNFDVFGAYDSLLRQATVQNPDALSDAGCPGQCTGQRPALDLYLATRYAPQDGCHCWGGAAETLENSLADFSLATWAHRLGRGRQHANLLERAGYWRNTFNPQATPTEGYQQARRLDGSWQPNFSPATDVGFAQGSSATYTWMVPHDVSGLSALMGGDDATAARLDRFFHDDAGNWAVRGGSPLRYDPTNEPGIHVPWMYHALGKPWKTHETVREILDTVYTTGPGGLPGNDDLGTMSAWYVFAAIGLFPQTPGRAELLIGAPVFSEVVIDRGNGVRLAISVRAGAQTDRYVTGATLNWLPYARSWLPESLVTLGGSVRLTLGAEPTGWGSAPATRPVDHVSLR